MDWTVWTATVAWVTGGAVWTATVEWVRSCQNSLGAGMDEGLLPVAWWTTAAWMAGDTN